MIVLFFTDQFLKSNNSVNRHKTESTQKVRMFLSVGNKIEG